MPAQTIHGLLLETHTLGGGSRTQDFLRALSLPKTHPPGRLVRRLEQINLWLQLWDAIPPLLTILRVKRPEPDVRSVLLARQSERTQPHSSERIKSPLAEATNRTRKMCHPSGTLSGRPRHKARCRPRNFPFPRQTPARCPCFDLDRGAVTAVVDDCQARHGHCLLVNPSALLWAKSKCGLARWLPTTRRFDFAAIIPREQCPAGRCLNRGDPSTPYSNGFHGKGGGGGRV